MKAIWKIIKLLLEQRGLTTKQQQAEFLEPPRPELLSRQQIGFSSSQLQRAKKRLHLAKKNQELIYVYGDYDADGVCATAILWEALHFSGFRALPYIPSRTDPIRGLSPQGIKSWKEKPSLIITVDNGISAFKGCQYAKKLGIDVIITDHHQAKHQDGKIKKPKAVAVLHTTQLAGAGVAWFFSQEVVGKLNQSLDLAALGTIADMVALIGPNRSLAQFGLQALRQTKRPGLQALAKTAGLDLQQISEQQISFGLAPRLNALGRLEHALDALRLVCTQDKARSQALAKHLNEINQLRQDKTVTMVADARKKVRQKQQLIFVADKSYHEGLVGLVAGQLAEKFQRPAVVVALGKHYSKASMRSVKGFNAIKSIRSLERFLLEHGGHELAAGFTINNQNLKLVQKKLEALAQKQLTAKKIKPKARYECEIKLEDISWGLLRELEKFRPFGFANPQPIFSSRGVRLVNFRTVGQENKHLKLKLEKFEAIAFNQGHLSRQLIPGQLINVVYVLERNDWNGKKELQLKIKEIKP